MHLIELYLIFAGHFALRQDNIRDITDSLIDHCEDRKLDENSNIQMSDEKVVGKWFKDGVEVVASDRVKLSHIGRYGVSNRRHTPGGRVGGQWPGG
jgi:hypothetical protein